MVCPVGNVASNLLLGVLIAQKAQHIEAGTVTGKPISVVQFFMTVYKDKGYTVREVFLGKEKVTHAS